MDIPKGVRKIWGVWNIRVFLLLSLLSQTFLVLFAPLRKRQQQKRVSRLIWSVYLFSDWVAIFALGLLSTNQDEDEDDFSSGYNGKDDLLALWAPFLLLHLGGPDTITAFALEDNELWVRHFLGLIYQLVPAGYVFLRSLPSNKYLVPTILIFGVGLIKYAERTWSLYLASIDAFTADYMNSLCTNRANYMLSIQRAVAAGGTQSSVVDVEPNQGTYTNDEPSSIQMVEFAYYFLDNLKGIVNDHMLTLFHLIKLRGVVMV